MIKPIFGIMFGLWGSLPLWAGVFTILPDKAGKWNEATSYLEGTGTPGADDVVLIPGSTDVVANAADIQFLENNGVGSICFGGKKGLVNPTLTVTVAEGDVAFSGRITNRTSKTEWTYSGTVIKEGSGILRLTQTGNIYGLCVAFTVNNGILEHPQKTDTSTFNSVYGKVTVNAPGILWPTACTKSSSTASSQFYGGLWGSGVVSNTVSGRAALLHIRPQSDTGEPEFSGRIDGNARVFLYGDASFTGTNSYNATSFHSIENGVNLKLAAVGGVYGGQSNPGALGSTPYLSLKGNPTVTYLGTDEVSYADFRGEKDFDATFTLNGGPNGGFEHRGGVSFSGSPKSTSTLVLTGDHTNACTLASSISNAVEGVVRTTRLVKRGSGIWQMKENADSELNGLVTVEDGILTADTLAETNGLCALGFANALEGAAAIVLGASSTTGTLAYAGTAAASVATRRIALAGDGRLTSAMAKLDWTGVTSADAQAHTLTVGGAADGVVRDIADGAGKVRIVKEGTGAWTLGGDLDFTGGLEVKAGTLALSSATNFFSWYRYTIKENLAGKSQYLDTGRFGLFDAAGNFLLSTNLVRNDVGFVDASKLKAGEYAPYTTRPAATLANLGEYSSYPIGSLFKWNNDGNGGFWRLEPAFVPSLGDAESWVGLVLRLPEGESRVSTYDVGSRWKSTAAEPSNNMIQSWSVEGSLDGVNWTELHSVVSNRLCGAAYRWRNGETAYYNASTPVYKKGQKILSGIAPTVSLDRGLDDVSVAVGATLTTDKDVVVRKITIDAAGMGSLSGVTLAEGGVIDIANAPAKGKFDVPVNLTAVTLPVSYSFTVNGSVSRRSVELSADRRSISIRPAGLVFVVR